MLKTAGTQAITTTDTATAGVTGNQNGITVNPAAASHLGVGAPATSIAGNPFNVTLTALDAYNNTAIGYTGTIHFTSSDPKAALLARLLVGSVGCLPRVERAGRPPARWAASGAQRRAPPRAGPRLPVPFWA